MSLYSDLAIQLDESAGATFWIQQQVLDALNEANLEVHARLRYTLSTVAAVAVSSGTEMLALSTTSLMIPQYVLDDQDRKLFSTTHAQLEDYDRAWRNASPARPEWLVLWDAATLRIFPRPDADYEYRIVGIPWPTEITSTIDDLPTSANPMIRRSVVLLAASKLFELTLPEHAQALASEAREFEARYSRTRRRELGDTSQRIKPAAAWQVAQLGDIRLGKRYR